MTKKLTPIEKWIKALRSGKYKQCKNYLHIKDDGYCCLGVASELYRKETKLGNWKQDDPNSNHLIFQVNGDQSRLYLIKQVYEWLGYQSEYFTRKYANLNDEGQTFKYIADKIEKDFLTNK